MESDLLAFTAQLWPFAWTEEVPPVTSIAGFKLSPGSYRGVWAIYNFVAVWIRYSSNEHIQLIRFVCTGRLVVIIEQNTHRNKAGSFQSDPNL